MQSKLLIIVCLVVVAAVHSEGAAEDVESSSGPSKIAALAENEDSRGERIFAYYTATSLTRLVTTTIIAISTCLSTNANANPPSCVGRKRRSVLEEAINPDDYKFENPELESSQDDVDVLPDQRSARVSREVQEDNERSGRKLTIWSTAFTTITVTSTSALTGTTVTVSILCALGGVGQSCFLG